MCLYTNDSLMQARSSKVRDALANPRLTNRFNQKYTCVVLPDTWTIKNQWRSSFSTGWNRPSNTGGRMKGKFGRTARAGLLIDVYGSLTFRHRLPSRWQTRTVTCGSYSMARFTIFDICERSF